METNNVEINEITDLEYCFNNLSINDNNDNNNNNTPSPPSPKKIMTEDLGKIFEMAICLLYETDYDGKYKYGLEEANQIKEKLYNLKNVFSTNIKHIAKNGNKYDFATMDDPPRFLSAKSKTRFCQLFEIPTETNIKTYIENNVVALLEKYTIHTFECPMVYYNKHKQIYWYIQQTTQIDWHDVGEIIFSHIKKKKVWNESTSVLVDGTTIGEFQIHNHRDCIKFRWAFEKLLKIFARNFDIIDL
jgi:hypothetical protein